MLVRHNMEVKKRDCMWEFDVYPERFNKARKVNRRLSSNPRIRRDLIEEQQNMCAGILNAKGQYLPCNRKPTQCDHIIEIRHGGKDEKKNLQMLCYICHGPGKTSFNCKKQIRY